MDENTLEQEIQAKGLTAPRVTPEMVKNVISKVEYRVLGETLTHCMLTLKNGFVVTGESACASPENFNEQIGRDIAYDNAKSQIWALEGYLLKEKIYTGKITS